MTGPGIDADLELTVTEDGRSSSGRITASGTTARIRFDDPDAAVAAAPPDAVRALTEVATLLGTRVEIYGRRRRLAVVDPARRGLRPTAAGVLVGLGPARRRLVAVVAVTATAVLVYLRQGRRS